MPGVHYVTPLKRGQKGIEGRLRPACPEPRKRSSRTKLNMQQEQDVIEVASAQLSGPQRALKTICTIMMILAVIMAALGVLLLFGSGLLAGETLNVEGRALDAAQAAQMLGVGMIVTAVIDFVIALLGAHGAKHPGKLGLFKIICIIGAILAIVGIAMGVMQAQYSSLVSNAVMAVLQIVCAGLAIKISNHAVYTE